MNLKELIEENLLEEFKDASIQQIQKRLLAGKSRLEFAKENFQKNKLHFNEIIYTNLYDAARIICESFLLLKGYRAKIRNHHKTVFTVISILLKDKKMEDILFRLDKMRRKRNMIDYDIDEIDISRKAIEQAIKDSEELIKIVEKEINKANPQDKFL